MQITLSIVQHAFNQVFILLAREHTLSLLRSSSSLPFFSLKTNLNPTNCDIRVPLLFPPPFPSPPLPLRIHAEEVEPGNHVEVLDTWPHVGPVTDFCVVDTERQGQVGRLFYFLFYLLLLFFFWRGEGEGNFEFSNIVHMQLDRLNTHRFYMFSIQVKTPKKMMKKIYFKRTKTAIK